MKIQDQFNLIAQEYDAKRRHFIPCFDDFYSTATKMILFNRPEPEKILDLGAGTGLVTYYWYQEAQDSDYVLVDIASEMLAVAEKRFSGIDTVRNQVMDYTKDFPEEKFDAIISGLSIHHLEDDEKQLLFNRIYEKLPAGGMFVNYDMFNGNTEEMNRYYTAFWEAQVAASGLTDRDIELWKERCKLDRECSVEEEVNMLRQSGFSDVQCIYSYHKFAVILAVKG